MRYLLDTTVCIALLKGNVSVRENLIAAGPEQCGISEITHAELLFGAEQSARPAFHHQQVESFVATTVVVPISASLAGFAMEKARLKRAGTPIADFDLLIGCTAQALDLTMVTHNTRHFERINGLQLADWELTSPSSFPLSTSSLGDTPS